MNYVRKKKRKEINRIGIFLNFSSQFSILFFSAFSDSFILLLLFLFCLCLLVGCVIRLHKHFVHVSSYHISRSTVECSMQDGRNWIGQRIDNCDEYVYVLKMTFLLGEHYRSVCTTVVRLPKESQTLYSYISCTQRIILRSQVTTHFL